MPRDPTLQEAWHVQYRSWLLEQGLTYKGLKDSRNKALEEIACEVDGIKDAFYKNHGYRLPQHLFTFLAFHRSLPPVVNTDFIGVETVFDAEVQSRLEEDAIKEGEITPTQSLLQWRSMRDPAEFLPILCGFGSKVNVRFGMWYDSPDKPPPFMAYFSGADERISSDGSSTCLEMLRMLVERHHDAWVSDFMASSASKRLELFKLHLLRECVMAFETGNRTERGQAYIDEYLELLINRVRCLDGIGLAPRHGQDPEKNFKITFTVTNKILTSYSQRLSERRKVWVDRAKEIFGITTHMSNGFHDLSWQKARGGGLAVDKLKDEVKEAMKEKKGIFEMNGGNKSEKKQYKSSSKGKEGGSDLLMSDSDTGRSGEDGDVSGDSNSEGRKKSKGGSILKKPNGVVPTRDKEGEGVSEDEGNHHLGKKKKGGSKKGRKEKEEKNAKGMNGEAKEKSKSKSMDGEIDPIKLFKENSSRIQATNDTPFAARHLIRHTVALVLPITMCWSLYLYNDAPLWQVLSLFIATVGAVYGGLVYVLGKDMLSTAEKELDLFVEVWINYAFQLAAEGHADLALTLGRNIRWYSFKWNPEMEGVGTELLIAGYRAEKQAAFKRMIRLNRFTSAEE